MTSVLPIYLQLLIPYRDYGNLPERERVHNHTLSQCRSSIERAFARWKGQWRRMKFFPHYCLQYVNDSIMACLVLHNFILLAGEEYEVRAVACPTVVP